MCFKVEKFLPVIDGAVAPSGLPLFVLDNIQHSVVSPFWFHVVLPSVAKNLKERVLSKRDVCEDG